MLLTITRTFKEAVNGLLRYRWLTIATSGILMLSLYVIGVLILMTFATSTVLTNIQEKANISLYFKQDISEDAINDIRSKLLADSDIKAVEYVSKEQALEDFKKNNADEQIIMDSLKEIGGNPLLSSLVVRAKDPNQYQKIYEDISGSDFASQISRINYGKNKEIINKLNTLVGSVKKIGVILEILLAGISILIIYNAVRLSIYGRRQEIEIMRLVGASNSFIRLPYFFEGVLYGLAATLISMLLLLLTVRALSSYVLAVAPSANIVSFYFQNFWSMLALQLFMGILIGVVSSLVAMRRYLRI